MAYDGEGKKIHVNQKGQLVELGTPDTMPNAVKKHGVLGASAKSAWNNVGGGLEKIGEKTGELFANTSSESTNKTTDSSTNSSNSKNNSNEANSPDSKPQDRMPHNKTPNDNLDNESITQNEENAKHRHTNRHAPVTNRPLHKDVHTSGDAVKAVKRLKRISNVKAATIGLESDVAEARKTATPEQTQALNRISQSLNEGRAISQTELKRAGVLVRQFKE